MACRLFGAKPLPEPMLTYFDPWVKPSSTFESKYDNFHSRKYVSNVVCKLLAILFSTHKAPPFLATSVGRSHISHLGFYLKLRSSDLTWIRVMGSHLAFVPNPFVWLSWQTLPKHSIPHSETCGKKQLFFLVRSGTYSYIQTWKCRPRNGGNFGSTSMC